MELLCQGNARKTHDSEIPKSKIISMNSKATNINETRISSWPAGGTDSFEIMYTNADCLSNKLNELEVVVNSLKP